MARLSSRIPDLPSEAEVELALESGKKIAAILDRGDKARLCLQDGEEQFEIPMSAAKILSEILDYVAQGNAISLMPVGYTLTTQAAADLMGVSRPHLVKLLESGEIEFSRVGRHRRVKYEDVVQYIRKVDEASRAAARELVEEAQKLNLGY